MLVGVVLIASDRRRSSGDVVIAIILVVHAAVRTLLPLTWSSRWRGVVQTLAEATISCAAVALTGQWNSPYVFTLVTSVVAAGFATGFGFAIPLAASISAIVTLLSLGNTDGLAQIVTAGTTELTLAAAVAGYGRRLFGEAERRTSTVLDRLSGLTETNDLLQALNAVAQALPASLNLPETVAEILGQLRTLFGGDATAVFLWDATLGHWTVAGAEGVRLPAALPEADLPVPVRSTAKQVPATTEAMLIDLSIAGPGMTPSGRCGLYAPLVARNSLVGVLAVEAQDPEGFSVRDLELMTGFAEQAALAIDNALWFGRLRTLGAEQERTRIARDLHDRVAQSLAYVAFELERIIELSRSRQVSDELEALRHDVRRVVTQVRDTLYDLRTEVTEAQDLDEAMTAFLKRVETRSHLTVSFKSQIARRLAVPLEREVWRIGQEAVVNAERHSGAEHLTVTWQVNAQAAELTVTDDGRGFPVGAAGRMDSYGLLGMRERADAIGATLEFQSAPGAGTTIRCRVEVM